MLPRVILHNAASVDGRMDWPTADIDLYYELAESWKADAMLSGSSTMLAAYPPGEDPVPAEGVSQPAETPPTGARQLLVVVDSRGRLRNWQRIRREPYWRDVVALCSRSTPAAYLDYLRKLRVDCVVTGEDHVDLRAALEALNARYGVEVVRVDSGGVLNGVLLRAGLVDEVSVMVSPCLVGGTTPRSIYVASDLASAGGAIPLRLAAVERLHGDAVWLRYEVLR